MSSEKGNVLEEDVRISVSVEMDDEKTAATVSRALKVDDDDFVTTRVSGLLVTAEVRASSVRGARRAADDWLACLISVLKD